jgi:tetratricopeptide (TPR) repeat protein
MLGFVLGLTNRVERAMEESLFAVELDPNLPLVYALMGLHALHLRRGEETESFVREALRRSPLDPLAFQWFAVVGFAKNSLGRYEEAVNWLRQSVSRIGTFAMARFHLCSALAHLGRMEEAQAAAAIGLEIDPTFTVARFRGPLISDDPYFLAWRERIAAGMRMAGVPQGAPASEGTAASALSP